MRQVCRRQCASSSSKVRQCQVQLHVCLVETAEWRVASEGPVLGVAQAQTDVDLHVHMHVQCVS
jgi:hypothetical protein